MNDVLNNVNIIIINYNGKQITENCINSLLNIQFPQKNIIISDNASSDNSPEYLKKLFPELKMAVNKKNLGYAGAINSGAALADKDYLILSNNDIIFQENSIQQLIGFLRNNENAGCIAPQQMFPDGAWQRSGGILPLPHKRYREYFLFSAIIDLIRSINYRFNLYDISYKSEYIDGGVIAVRKGLFDKLDGFDEDYFFYSEEADFCYRISNFGCYNAIVPKSRVIHLRGASSDDIKINDKALELLVTGKFKFLNKYFSKNEIKKYIRAVITNHKIYITLWNILKKMKLVSSEKADEKIAYFKKSISIWKQMHNNDKFSTFAADK